MIMMGKHESFRVDKDSAEGIVDLETLALRMAQSKGLKIDGKYHFVVFIKNERLYWRVDHVTDGIE